MLKLPTYSATIAALTAAFLFGASTPLAKQLVGSISPLLLAGLLYLGSGLGLTITKFIRDKHCRSNLPPHEWSWLAGAIFFGGLLAPLLLMLGLLQTASATASLLLNLESVLTAVLAWLFFKEHTDRRMILGMLLIVAGGVILSWTTQWQWKDGLSVIAIAGACLCWAIDNNLTRKIASSDSLFIAGTKGLVSGIVNMSLAIFLGTKWPALLTINTALLVGFFGYGISLVLFIVALRGLGTARAGAYYSIAPFIGAAVAIIFFKEATTIYFWIAALLMGLGVWIHLTEHHEHLHTHESLLHDHPHIHDEHHQHQHDFFWDGTEPHTHLHEHEKISHSHHHYPDVHHQHKHG